MTNTYFDVEYVLLNPLVKPTYMNIPITCGAACWWAHIWSDIVGVRFLDGSF